MNILVPTDFSEMADNALSYATMIATKLQAKIILLHVIPPNGVWWTSFNSELISDARQKQETIKNRLVAGGMNPLSIETHVICDFPLTRYINDFISGHRIDFIVMGTGGTGLAKTKPGSFTMGMIDNVSLPIIAVPAQAKAVPIGRILYPTDLEDVLGETRRILPLAKAFGASVHIVHIPGESVGEEILAHHSLRDISKLAGYEHITTEVAHGDHIADVIDDRLVATGADVLVMFAHEKGFFEKLFSGSRTEQVSSHTRIPLLVYKKALKQS